MISGWGKLPRLVPLSGKGQMCLNWFILVVGTIEASSMGGVSLHPILRGFPRLAGGALCPGYHQICLKERRSMVAPCLGLLHELLL